MVQSEWAALSKQQQQQPRGGKQLRERSGGHFLPPPHSLALLPGAFLSLSAWALFELVHPLSFNEATVPG